jgi:hypothetical protein
MECPRGSETTSSVHEVKTIQKAEEWCGGMIENMHLPLTIHQDKTPNGRLRIKIFNDKGCLIVERG